MVVDGLHSRLPEKQNVGFLFRFFGTTICIVYSVGQKAPARVQAVARIE